MTPPASTTGTTGAFRHPDVSEISDLTEGLLSPTRSAEVRRHLDDCALCADVRASLEEIRAVLGTLPGPARMPADVAGRIDAALAAEALLDSTSPGASDEDGRPVPADRRPRPTGRDVSRETSPSGHPNGPSGPGRRRARRRIAVLTGLAGAAACALGIFLFSDLSGPPSHDAAARREASSSAAQPPTDGDYTAQGLRGRVRQLLDSGQNTKAAPQGEQNKTYGMENTPAPGIAPNDRQAPSVPACVQSATGRPETPIASERGTYQGTPVLLLVLPHPADASRVDAYLVDSGCESTTPATPGKLLLTDTYLR
ncbi:anti-sigma factor family protein [Streptomyces sp. NPDC056224]|uniref:anti-sigma factor family protein n=1 Tax=Streptomyces sp. NPDC056224 TaxID=3345750 RepID=UPI0035E2AD6B